MITIRPAREEDAADMVDILVPIIEAGIYTILPPVSLEEQIAFIRGFPERGVFNVAVSEPSGKVVGLQDVEAASKEAAWAHVGSIATFVSLSDQRRGIGRRLCEKTCEDARAHGFRKLLAFIRADNAPGIAFYTGLGFRVIGTAREHAWVNGRYVDEILTEKLL